jgi:dTMP kinase
VTDPARGRFISFEGGEGAGKSTQIGRLVSCLENRGLPVIQTREPGGTPAAEAIRDVLLADLPSGETWDAIAETLLHFAARRQHVANRIEPALAAGKWVLCDRFFDSTTAYQGYGMGVDPGLVDDLRRLTLGDFQPDLTLLLDIPVEHGLSRAGKRADMDTRYEKMALSFHEKLRDGFLAIARNEPDRFHVVDALQSADVVEKEIAGTVVTRFNLS